MSNMELFERAREISAADLARQAGIPLRQKGDRVWACCPFHKERTPSCCFYPDGRFYCFGCHANGDGIDFYAALNGVSKLQAAQSITQGAAPSRQVRKPPRPDRPPFLDDVDEEGYTWDRLCSIRNKAAETVQSEEPDSDRFWTALKAKALAEDRLDNLFEGEL